MPTQAANNKKTNFTVNIYNGTKYSGLASAFKGLLTQKGYKVGDIGNADRRDYTITLIQYKNGVDPNILKDIQALLETQGYNVAEPELDNNIKADIAIYLGKV